MTREEDFFKENFPEYVTEKGEFLSPYWDLFRAGVICTTFELKVKIEQLEKENAELDCQKNRNKSCYSCANATERCFKNEIGCPCQKYKSYKDEITELKEKLEQIEKENTELKERLLKVENAYKRKSEAEWRLNDLYQKVLTDFANAEKCSREYFTRYIDMQEHFIKAKELLKQWLQIAQKNNTRCYGFVYDTEQFLKELEK